MGFTISLGKRERVSPGPLDLGGREEADGADAGRDAEGGKREKNLLTRKRASASWSIGIGMEVRTAAMALWR